MNKTLKMMVAGCLAAAASVSANADVVTDTIAFYETPNAEISNSGTSTGKNCSVTWSGIGSTNSNVYISSEGVYYNKFTGASSYMQITPDAPEKCKVGDKVSITINNASAKKDGGCYLHAANGNQVNAEMTAANTEVTATYVLTSDDIEDDGSIKLFRISSNCRVHSYLVTRERTLRTFTDFEIDLTKEVPTLPDGVTGSGAKYNGTQHGWQDYTVTFTTDGPVEITIKGCQYANKQATVTDAEGNVLATLDTKSVGCDGTVTFTYNEETAATLTVYLGQYSPGISVKAVEKVNDCTIKYYDTDGTTKLGEDIVKPNSELALKYGESDVTIASGKVFRGWFTTVGRKVAGGEAILGDMSLYAKATDKEEATTTARYIYNIYDPYWYQEDHECITIENGLYHDDTHGWVIKANGTIAVKVGGKAYVSITNCQFSAEGTVTVTDESGNTVSSFQQKTANDGEETTFFYDGPATTLTFTFPATAYVHTIKIYNVLNEVTESNGYIMIPANDANSFIIALSSANTTGNKKIFLPNGTYDLGEQTLTAISGSDISIIGESIKGTVIKNAPAVEKESIGGTATLLNSSTGLYMQDLTLENDLDYYKNNNGRAVTLQDKGTKTVCKNVNLKSCQDTYYSNAKDGLYYFEDGEIHGTVDYICGGGSAYFKNVDLICEQRQANGGGSDAITASNCLEGEKGYLFDGCTIKFADGISGTLPIISLGRSWNNSPKCVYLNTVVDNTNGEPVFTYEKNGTPDIARWTVTGMNVLPTLFAEYNTTDLNGKVISPESNNVTFTYNGTTKDMNTILTADEAAAYTAESTLGDWAASAKASAVQAELTSVTISADKTTLSWDAVDGSAAYLIYINDEQARLVTETSVTVNGTIEKASVRAANARGGFGTAVEAQPESSVKSVVTTATDVKKYNVAGQLMNNIHRGIVVTKGKKYMNK